MGIENPEHSKRSHPLDICCHATGRMRMQSCKYIHTRSPRASLRIIHLKQTEWHFRNTCQLQSPVKLLFLTALKASPDSSLIMTYALLIQTLMWTHALPTTKCFGRYCVRTQRPKPLASESVRVRGPLCTDTIGGSHPCCLPIPPHLNE